MNVTEKLERAAVIWAESAGHAPSEVDHIDELMEMSIFSNRQVAKICRVSSSFVQRFGKASTGGGRFNPSTLTALVQLSRMHDKGEKLSKPLLQAVVEDGTSLNYVARVLKISHGSLYYYYKNKEG